MPSALAVCRAVPYSIEQFLTVGKVLAKAAASGMVLVKAVASDMVLATTLLKCQKMFLMSFTNFRDKREHFQGLRDTSLIQGLSLKIRDSWQVCQGRTQDFENRG